ncbi:glycosyltransferase [Flexivirga caeni]|uniref:glycosyltransferase n=1 Tax=Flexivirga caeni TaxID=2294115 RepID=UPI00131544BC|nr:nucleotide disphospho-sugar-binding domain-containing protein [Flexivirga caeni]
MATEDLTELVVPALEGLAGQDVIVIAALGRDPSSLRIEPPANARIANYLPFDLLLPRADLLVTNGVFGATQQALACGVPVIIAGATEDKQIVAAHLTYHEAGIDLHTQRPTKERVTGAVLEVLDSERYRKTA